MGMYEDDLAEWGDPEEIELKAAIGAYLKAKMKAQAKPEEKPNVQP